MIAAPNDAVLNVLERSPLGQRIGREQMFYNVETAVAHHEALSRTITEMRDKLPI